MNVSQSLNWRREEQMSHLVTKPTKWLCAQRSLGIRPVWSVFAVRTKKAWVLSYPLSAQRKLWSDWADALSYMCFVLLPFNYTNPSLSLVYYFLTSHLFYSTNPPPPLHLCTEPRLMSSTEVKTYRKKGKKERCPGWSESSLGAQSFCWFCHEAAQIHTVQ